MRHLRKRIKINRTSAHRNAMIANMINSFLKHEKIKTTRAKAKLIKPVAEKIITRAKTNTLHSRKQIYKVLRRWDMMPKLFEKIAPRFKKRAGGYTRIVPIGPRNSDNAEMVFLEMVETFEEKGKSERS
ncbi:MAG: 50S ribosomal protein L17 [Spirochaetes bacterium]|nr:50S ribosomal protein L17 [Spirochaetota bacterium]